MSKDDLTKKVELAFNDFIMKTEGMPCKLIASILASVLCLMFKNIQIQGKFLIEPEIFIEEFSDVLRNKMRVAGLMKGEAEKIH